MLEEVNAACERGHVVEVVNGDWARLLLEGLQPPPSSACSPSPSMRVHWQKKLDELHQLDHAGEGEEQKRSSPSQQEEGGEEVAGKALNEAEVRAGWKAKRPKGSSWSHSSISTQQMTERERQQWREGKESGDEVQLKEDEQEERNERKEEEGEEEEWIVEDPRDEEERRQRQKSLSRRSSSSRVTAAEKRKKANTTAQGRSASSNTSYTTHHSTPTHQQPHPSCSSPSTPSLDPPSPSCPATDLSLLLGCVVGEVAGSEAACDDDEYVDDAALSYSSSEFEPDESEDGVESSEYSATPEDQGWATEVAEGAIRITRRRSHPPPLKAAQKTAKARRRRVISDDDEDGHTDGSDEEERGRDQWKEQERNAHQRPSNTAIKPAPAKRKVQRAASLEKRGVQVGGEEGKAKTGKRGEVVGSQRAVAAPPPAVIDQSLGFSGITRNKEQLLLFAQQCRPHFRSPHKLCPM